MEITLAILLALGLGGSTVDVVKGSNYVETAFMSVCKNTGGQWVKQGQPDAACVGQDFNLGKEEKV